MMLCYILCLAIMVQTLVGSVDPEFGQEVVNQGNPDNDRDNPYDKDDSQADHKSKDNDVNKVQSSLKASRATEDLPVDELVLPRVRFYATTFYGQEGNRDCQDLDKYVIENLKINGIECERGSSDHSRSADVSVWIDMKIDRDLVLFALKIRDACGIREYPIKGYPGQWYAICRLICDKVSEAVFGRSSAFSQNLIVVTVRNDGRQELSRAYMDGIEDEPFGRSYRRIYKAARIPDGVLYLALENSSTSMMKYSFDNTITRIDLPKNIYTFAVHETKVAYGHMLDDGSFTVAMVDLNSQEAPWEIASGHATSLTFSPCGRYLALISNSSKRPIVHIYQDGKFLKVLDCGYIVRAVSWSPCNKNLLALLVEKASDLRNRQSESLVRALALSHGSSKKHTDGEPCKESQYFIVLMDINGRILKTSGTMSSINSLNWKVDGSGLIICGSDETLYTMPVSTMELFNICRGDVRYKYAIM